MIGLDDETAMATRLSQHAGIPVAATCASAVLAIRALGVNGIALVDPPWFGDELNELGAAYFRNQGVEVVVGVGRPLPRSTPG